ncbi:MAG: thioredoxin domain-containing protein [Acidobacteriota bacterium]
MKKASTLLLLTILCAGVSAVAFAETDNSEERKQKILANLQSQFPQLKQASITMANLESSGYGDLDRGSFTINNRQTQKFLVSPDDTALFMISDPIDVSRSSTELAEEAAKQEAEAAVKAAEVAKELEAEIAGLPFRGNPDAPVTIVEYSDFQCPYCARGAKTIDEVLEKYPNDVKVVFQHFPLSFHPWAKPAAVAAHCVGMQNNDAFWALHDKYFANQKELTPANVLEKTQEYLADSGIDMVKYTTCAEEKESAEYKEALAAVDAAMANGGKRGVTGTPGFFVNGRFLNGAQPLAAFEPLIKAAKKAAADS